MQRVIWFLVVAAISLLPIRPAFAQNNGIFGYWKAIDSETGQPQTIIRLWEYQGKLIGSIVKVFPQPGKKNNPVCDECRGPLHNKPIIGLNFLWGFVRDGGDDRKWVNGNILDPRDGERYHCQLELADGGNKLNVFGYVRLLFKIGRTEVWLRASPEEVRS
jgi:uncharacterized protein (DUF2147 family)